MQAEAVADLIDAVTPLQARAAFDQLNGTLTGKIAAIDAALFDFIARLEASVDFPEEGYHFVEPGELVTAIDVIIEQTSILLRDARRGRMVREGLQVAIVGAPNVGKSSLFNALVGASRAIVDETAGTTRDIVSETVDVHGLRVTLVDTAGLRPTEDRVEREGVSRAELAARVADLLIVVRDRSRPLEMSDAPVPEDTKTKRLVVANKTDLPQRWTDAEAIAVSARTGEGLERLREAIVEALDIELGADRPEITNVRHIALVERADDALRRARTAAQAGGRSMSEEFVLADLQDARAALEEVTGRRAPDDVLAHIFERFCVGK
jgi:tRNA modification GTPase